MYQRFHTALTAVCLSLLLAGCSASEPPLTQTIASDQGVDGCGRQPHFHPDGRVPAPKRKPFRTGSGEPSVDASYLDAGQAKATALEHAGISEENAILPKSGRITMTDASSMKSRFPRTGRNTNTKSMPLPAKSCNMESNPTGMTSPSLLPSRTGAALSEERARQIALDLVPAPAITTSASNRLR